MGPPMEVSSGCFPYLARSSKDMTWTGKLLVTLHYPLILRNHSGSLASHFTGKKIPWKKKSSNPPVAPLPRPKKPSGSSSSWSQHAWTSFWRIETKHHDCCYSQVHPLYQHLEDPWKREIGFCRGAMGWYGTRCRHYVLRERERRKERKKERHQIWEHIQIYIYIYMRVYMVPSTNYMLPVSCACHCEQGDVVII